MYLSLSVSVYITVTASVLMSLCLPVSLCPTPPTNRGGPLQIPKLGSFLLRLSQISKVHPFKLGWSSDTASNSSPTDKSAVSLTSGSNRFFPLLFTVLLRQKKRPVSETNHTFTLNFVCLSCFELSVICAAELISNNDRTNYVCVPPLSVSSF